MTVFVDVEPRFDDEAGKQVAVDIREAVAAGVLDALEALRFGLSLTSDERDAVAKHRNNKAANVRRARAHIARGVNAGKANS